MSEYNYDDRIGGTPNEDEAGPTGGTQDAINAARARLNAAYEKTREKSNAALRQAEGYIRESPLQAVGYAAGVAAVIGLIAGMIIGGRD
jgi:ElaB/YqjD/DUF883 family membrane-anchored ribosome-binding protein